MWLQDLSFMLVSSFASLSVTVDGVPAGSSPGSTDQADESRNKGEQLQLFGGLPLFV